ncbi:MAG: hypothetical protein G01um101425_1003 [Candidatus Peregrinibacteria bacterium Gr01-1014_25]|nr:MAG: hypothetical protein G01um101425_1003 [Candidatus Peregrinibacteria bacterium Gr01-1014_25]
MAFSPRRLFIIGAAVCLAAGSWWLLSPLWRTNVVNDAFPPAMTEAERTTLQELETLTTEKAKRLSPRKREEMRKAIDTLGAKMPDTPMDDDMPTDGPVSISSGSFHDGDGFHRGSGMATIYRLDDGAYVLRLEKFSVTNGPALHVYLVRDSEGDVDGGYLDLGALKGNKGNQTYDISPEVDVSQFKSVVIWCVPFGVLFSIATLA